LLLLLARWLPDRQVIAVADSSYAAIELLAAVRRHVTVITRLRLDARLFDPPPPRLPGTKGRPRVSGARQPTLLQRLADPNTAWQRVTVTSWYGQGERRLDVVSGTAIWYYPGKQVPIRWLLVRDVAGEFEPQAFACTDQAADPLDVLRCFVRRWSVEVTFAEVRRHLGVETQRQWSDLAIARTTPCLLALFSLVTLWARRRPQRTLDRAGFLNIPARPGHGDNPPRAPRQPHRSRMLPSLKWPKSSLGVIRKYPNLIA